MSILGSVLSVALLVTLASAVPLFNNVDVPDHNEREDTVTYRLDGNVVPSAYTIKLTPNIVPNRLTFAGESTIAISITNSTTKIVLHAKDLDIVEAKTKLVAVDDPKKVFVPESQDLKNVTDFLTLQFKKTTEIPAGKYLLYLSYAGKLHRDLNGFYASSYINDRGEEVWLATTQFEPTHARRAFPCFDEPALKATFDISISHFDNYTVRSNTKRKSVIDDPADSTRSLSQFEVTPKMSTYLVAFIVSDFEYLTNAKNDFRVYARRNAIKTGKYALEIGQKELELLEKYTQIKYSTRMKKMDNFAIPQFRAGAMENWGIVTYRESALLFEENVTTTAAKQSIATVISHEFAHQWFGNLVGPLWWEFTWLNEGFATYFQYYITDKVEPTWRLMEQFVIKDLQETSFVADVKEDQHAMNHDVNSPKEISANFDSISYSKAGCVIRMFSHALTEEIFKKGLTAYLTTMTDKAAKSDDLFDELVKVAPQQKNLKEALTSWATQRGYPVLSVTIDPKTGKAQVSQKRFLLKTATKPPQEKWVIPINYATEEGLAFDKTQPDEWVTKEGKNEFTITGYKEKKWVIFNKQHTGYYRVNYDKTNWGLITAYLQTKYYSNINVLNRAQILDDSFNLAHAGEHTDYQVFLDISRYLHQEYDYVAWHAAFRAFSVLQKALANTAKYDLFKKYMLKLTDTLESSVGYTEVYEEGHVMKFNRNNAVNWACHMGSVLCRHATRKRVIERLEGTKNISVDLQSVMFCAGMRDANASLWDKTFKLYETSKVAAERNAIVNGLGCASDTKILNSYLTKSIEKDSTITVQTALKAVYTGSASGINVAFDFINANYAAIYKIDEGSTIVTCMSQIANRLTTKAQVEKLKKFINDPKNKDVKEKLEEKKVVENANSNVEWVTKNEEHIGTFLDAQNLVPISTTPTPTTEKPADDKNRSPSISLPTVSFTVFLVLIARFASSIH